MSSWPRPGRQSKRAGLAGSLSQISLALEPLAPFMPIEWRVVAIMHKRYRINPNEPLITDSVSEPAMTNNQTIDGVPRERVREQVPAAQPQGEQTAPIAAPLNYGSLDAVQRLAVCRGSRASAPDSQFSRLDACLIAQPNAAPTQSTTCSIV